MSHKPSNVVIEHANHAVTSHGGNLEIRVVQEVWARAAGFFDSQTRDPKKKLYVKNFVQSEPHIFHKILLEQTTALQELRFTERSSWHGRFERVLQTIDDHACVGDVFVQGQSTAVAFAWGSVRLCLRLATADLAIGQDIASNLFDITELLASAEERLKLFPFTDSLLRAASHLFTSILLYVVKAIFFLQQKLHPARALKAASGGSAKFKRMYQDILRHTSWLDREFSNAVETRTRYISQLQLVLQWLYRPKQSTVDRAPPVSGTCQWLLESNECRAWMASGHSNVLLIEGAPGCGKSVLADYLSLTIATELTFLHSCYDSPGILAFCHATLAWLVRIVLHASKPTHWHASVVDETLPLAWLSHSRSRFGLEPSLRVLQHILSRTELPETTIIVDALGECQDEAQPLFKFFESITQSPRVRVICFSRSSTQIRSASAASTTIQMDESRVKSDVELYARKRIQETKSLQDVESQILHSISKTCSGLFLLTALLLDDLESADTLEDQLEIFKAAPGCLFNRFEQRWLRDQSNLTEKQRIMRLEIFTLLVVARRPLNVGEVSSFLALDASTNTIREERTLKTPAHTIEKFCQPLVSVDNGKVEILHPAKRDFLVSRPLAHRDSNAHLAEKCLSVLIEERYKRVQSVAALLRKHLLPTGLLVSGVVSKINDEPLPYEYAALNWQSHVTAVPKPSKVLLTKLGEFLTSIAAVTWSERLVDIRGRNEASSINVQIDVRAELSAWVKTLPPALQNEIPLNEFFVTAHIKIQQMLGKDDEEDHLLPYLPAIRLGQYFSIAGTSDYDFRQAYEYKKLVVEGFTKWLGKRSPLTLQARTEFINEFFSQGLIAEAEEELIEVVSIEKDVLGTDSDAYYSAIQLLGNAQYYLTKFADASRSLQKSGEGLLRLLGKESWDYQVNNLYHGWVYEREGDLDSALQLYEKIVEEWVPVRGKTNGLSIYASTSMGSVFRKKQDYEKARLDLEFSWESRLRLFSIDSHTTVDSALQLALLCREMGLAKTALELLDQVERSSVFEKDFERACQVRHVRALVAFDQGHFSDPVRDLMKIVDATVGSNRDQNNRECQWIRITLADALRHVGKDAEALMFFSELVNPLEDGLAPRPSTPTLDNEPEPPAQLKIAEKALRMVKGRDPVGAIQLLRSKKLQWKRGEDFFIRQGGPPADTAWTTPFNFSALTAGLD